MESTSRASKGVWSIAMLFVAALAIVSLLT